MPDFSLGDDIVDLTDELRELKAEDKRSALQRRYYRYLKEPKPIDKLPRISLRGDRLPKELRRIVKKWQKRLGLEKYLIIIEEVDSELGYEFEDVESETYAKLFAIDKNGDKVETEPPLVRLDSKRVEAGDFVLIYVKFYLLL